MTQHLLVAADRYDLTRLRAICESRLCDMVDVETAATTLALAEQNHAHALKRACLEYVALHLAEVMQTDGYKHMEQSCPQLASELLRTVAMRDTTQQQQATAMANANAASIPWSAPRARRRRRRRVRRRTAVAHPGCGGGRDGRRARGWDGRGWDDPDGWGPGGAPRRPGRTRGVCVAAAVSRRHE